METIIIGETIVVGNNIDTDQIYLGCFLALTGPKEIGGYYLSGVDEDIAVSSSKGGTVIARTNPGCGPSREHIPIALLRMGAPAVIADSLARIFLHNSINLGLSLVVCRGISKKVKYGQTLELDLENGTVTVMETGGCWLCEKVGEQAFRILETGEIKSMMRKRTRKGGE